MLDAYYNDKILKKIKSTIVRKNIASIGTKVSCFTDKKIPKGKRIKDINVIR